MKRKNASSMSRSYGEHARDFKKGDRVELHPGTDRWAMGDRYGTVTSTSVKKGRVRVLMDRSGDGLWFAPSRLAWVETFTNPIDWNRYASTATDYARRGYGAASPHVKRAARAAGRATVAAGRAAARGARKATKATARGLGPLAQRAGAAVERWGRTNKPPRKAKRAGARRPGR